MKHKITSLILAFLLLLSATGVSLDLHFCGTELFEFSLIGDVTTCGEIDESDDYLKFKKVSCCTADHFCIETSDNYKTFDFKKELNTVFDFQFNNTIEYIVPQSFKFIKEVADFSPPEKTKSTELFLFYESFVI